MNILDIKKIAKKWGIPTTGLKKNDLIKKIQAVEGNDPCFGEIPECAQLDCIWYKDCTGKKPPNN